MRKRIETIEQYNKAISWTIEMAEHPLEPLKSDPVLAEKYRITEKAIRDYNERTIPTLYDDLDPEPVQEPEPIKEPTTAAKASWLDD